MIDALEGKLIAWEDDHALLDTGGVTFRLDIPASTAGTFTEPGINVRLLTRLSFNPNEGTFALFGFGTEAERDCFDIFTQISGIGPRKGLLILSQIEIGAFAQAILTNDLTYLSKLKGVGKKTAERLVVELREKMVPYTRASDAPSQTAGDAIHIRDAVAGLMALGCRPNVAESAIRLAVEELGEDATAAELIKAGLRHR